MGKAILYFHMSKALKGKTSQSFILYALALFACVPDFAFSQTSYTNCILDIRNFSFSNNPNCESGNWGGFINKTCCGGAFDDYLYALAWRANQSGAIYLNSSEQNNCFTPIKKYEKDVIGCVIERLTSGAGGCSDYTVSDVVRKLGHKFKALQEDCKNLGSNGTLDQHCGACLRRWKGIGGSSDSKQDSAEVQADVCRFAVLVSVISNRIADGSWVHAVFKCLGEQSFPLDGTASDNAQTSSGRKDIKKSTGLWILIGGLVGIMGILAFATWILFKKGNKESLPPGKDASDDSLSGESSNLKISIKEVYLATDNLNPSNFIGQGIAGKVYKGILSNGQHVAVKHIINDGQVETFVREVKSLSHIRHPNLVALLGHCEREDECFLVYELCHYGNVSEWLFGKDKLLSWTQRLEIANGSARGLWFLHTYQEGCIVHRDIKPTNILINANFEAKLSDFGLSKVMDIGQSYVSSEVRGTFGYVDPEYRRNHHVNASGDVYSFGIVLLQLLSGQRVINMNLTRPLPLSKRARYLTRGGNVAGFADPKLNGEYSWEAFDLVLKLALSCTGIKQERPSMEQVVLQLEKALDISQTEPVTYQVCNGREEAF